MAAAQQCCEGGVGAAGKTGICARRGAREGECGAREGDCGAPHCGATRKKEVPWDCGSAASSFCDMAGRRVKARSPSVPYDHSVPRCGSIDSTPLLPTAHIRYGRPIQPYL